MDILAALSQSKPLTTHKNDKEYEMVLIPWKWYKKWLIKYEATQNEIDECFTFEKPCHWKEHLNYFEKRFNNND